ncbi:hypothetical protein BH11ACT8_BH11ACT8_24190 [soil metagenome]
MSALTTVLGIGNPLMGDDGVGITLLEQLMAGGLEQPVEFVDGGTIGLSLLPLVLDTDSLLVLDAVAGPGPGTGSGTGSGSEPGTVVHLSGDQLPRLLRMKLSPHQVGLLDVLAGARLLGSEPSRMAVVGIVPGYVDLRLGLGPEVEAAVPLALELAREVLREWWAADSGLLAPAGQVAGGTGRAGGTSCSGSSTST